MDATGTPFRKISDDTAFGVSVTTVAPVTDITLPYKLTGQTGRVLVADVCGDNDLMVGFPASKNSAGEAVLLQRAGYFITTMKGGAGTVGQPFTAAVGGIRVAVPGVDIVQGYIATAAAQDARVTVRPLA